MNRHEEQRLPHVKKMVTRRPMLERPIARTVVATTVALLLGLSTPPAAAQDNALHLLVSNGMKGSMEALQGQCEEEVGRRLAIQFGSTASLKRRIEAGEAFDVTIITIEAIDDLIMKALLTSASRMAVGRSELGVGIRAGVSKPDIRSVATFRQALRQAPSITYPQDGASRGYIEQMFGRLGIADDVKSKIILAPGSGPATESVAAGKAAMVLTLFSEIVPAHGVEILGPFPGEYQSDIRFGAAASAQSTHADAATALIAFLAGPKVTAVLKARGIDRPR
jgi:molybdate transport system substrate-binding protein